MHHHIDDGRVWAVDARTGDKARHDPQTIRKSKHLRLAPSERAKGKRVTEPAQPKPKPKGKPQQKPKRVTEPATKKPEPDNSQPVTEPENPSEEAKEK